MGYVPQTNSWAMSRHKRNNHGPIPYIIHGPVPNYIKSYHEVMTTDHIKDHIISYQRPYHIRIPIKRLLDDAFAQQQYYRFRSKLLLDDVSTQQQ